MTSEYEQMKDDMDNLTKKLGRIDNEFIQIEMHVKEQRKHLEKLDKQLKDYTNGEDALDKENQKLLEEIKQFDLPNKIRISHLNSSRPFWGSESVFGNKTPTVILENKTIIGSRSVLPMNASQIRLKNRQVQSSRGFCGGVFGSMFGGKK